MLARAAAALLLCSLALAGCGDDGGTGAAADTGDPTGSTGSATPTGVSCSYQQGGPAAKEVDPPPAEATVSGTVAATMRTSVGDLGLSLDADSAPCTVGSFVSLAEQGYFDGTSCHRLTTAGIFVLQCGDPTATGTGGPGYTVPDELSGKETYRAGTLAMANTGRPNTGGSQFFIVYGDTQLPPSYAVFGTLDKAGLEAVRKVAEAGTDNAFGDGDGHPNTEVKIESVDVG